MYNVTIYKQSPHDPHSNTWTKRNYMQC